MTSEPRRRGPRCPHCDGTDTVPVLYGLPTREAMEAARRGEYHLGGCCVMGDGVDPTWHCRTCDNGFIPRTRGPRRTSRFNDWGADLVMTPPPKSSTASAQPIREIETDGITDLCQRYHAGLLPFEALIRRLVAYQWKSTWHSRGPTDLAERMDYVDEHALDVEQGTVSELEHCMGLGLITHDELCDILQAVAESATRES